MTNEFWLWPWWLQLVGALLITVGALIVRETIRLERRHRRYMNQLAIRLARIPEDSWWRTYREREYRHALDLRARRLARQSPIPERLLKAVRDR